MHADSVLLTQDGTNMAMPKKKTTIKKTASKTTPKKKVSKNVSDVVDYIKKGGRDAEPNWNPKKQQLTTHIPSKQGPYDLSTKTTKQGKSGFSSVVHRNATFTNQNKDYGKRGVVSPIANPKKAFMAIEEAARQDDIRNRRRNSVKKKGK